jgi:hypothetical protein
MNMVCSRFALRLLSRADALGTREALIGDLLEELSCGRSRWWFYQQLIGLYGFALVTHARHHARLRPSMVSVALGAVLFGGLSIASAGSVMIAWLGFYLVMGTLSLFAHMAARAQVDVRF